MRLPGRPWEPGEGQRAIAVCQIMNTVAHARPSGNKTMRIGLPQLQVRDGVARLTAPVTCDSERHELWYEVPDTCADWFATDRSDGFVVGLILHAMHRGEDLVVEGPMSARLHHNLTHFYIPVVTEGLPDRHRPIRILPNSLTTARTGANHVATGFSGGVDSFAAVVQHWVQEPSAYDRVTHLLFHNVGSHRHGSVEDDRRLFRQRFEQVQPFAREVGLPIVPVDSNLGNLFSLSYVKNHAAVNPSVPLVLQHQFRRYYYASCRKYSECWIRPAKGIGSLDPVTMPLLGTENFDCVSTGCQMSRVEKTQLVATYEPSYRFLNVCVDPTASGRNCSVCQKCGRTLLTLELLGLARHYAPAFDLEKYRKTRPKLLLRILRHKPATFEREVAELYMQRGHGPAAHLLKLRKWLDKLGDW